MNIRTSFDANPNLNARNIRIDRVFETNGDTNIYYEDPLMRFDNNLTPKNKKRLDMNSIQNTSMNNPPGNTSHNNQSIQEGSPMCLAENYLQSMKNQRDHLLGGKHDNLYQIRNNIEEFCQNLDVERKEVLDKIGSYTDQFKRDVKEESKREVSPQDSDYKEKRKIIENLGKKVSNKEIDNLCLELEKLEKEKLIKELYGVIKQYQHTDKSEISPIDHIQTIIKKKAYDVSPKNTQKKKLKHKVDGLYEEYLNNFDYYIKNDKKLSVSPDSLNLLESDDDDKFFVDPQNDSGDNLSNDSALKSPAFIGKQKMLKESLIKPMTKNDFVKKYLQKSNQPYNDDYSNKPRDQLYTKNSFLQDQSSILNTYFENGKQESGTPNDSKYKKLKSDFNELRDKSKQIKSQNLELRNNSEMAKKRTNELFDKLNTLYRELSNEKKDNFNNKKSYQNLKSQIRFASNKIDRNFVFLKEYLFL